MSWILSLQAFGRKSFPDKGLVRSSSKKRKTKEKAGQPNQPFQDQSDRGQSCGRLEYRSRRGKPNRGREVSHPPPTNICLPPLSNGTDVGGRLLGFRNACRHNSWAFLVVSQGLTWSWFPRKPALTNCRGQVSTFLLKEYFKEILNIKAIVPVAGKK